MTKPPTTHSVAHAALVAEFGKGFHVGTLDLREIEDTITFALIEAFGSSLDDAAETAATLAPKFDGTVLS